MDETPETFQHPPSGDTGKPQGGNQRAPGFSGENQSDAGFESQHEEDDEDDKDSVVELPPPDKMYARLVEYIYDRFPHLRPASAP